MMYEHVLGGCTPTPLAHYLKALGIMRLVAEQKDQDAAGFWQGEQFVLRTTLTRGELSRFLLDEYRPSSVVAPWNGGSGFFPNDNKTGIDLIAGSNSERFRLYREVIDIGRACVMESSLTESPKNDEKFTFLGAVRAKLPDSALAWFDAAVMLASEKPEYPPLLGTGGNDGRLDFTNNFMQRLTELIDAGDGAPSSKSTVWLKGALDGDAAYGLVSKAIGQYSPGNAGGPNACSGFSSESLMNPWDFVLMLEGALLFAGTTTRRLEGSDRSGLSYPFTVRSTGAGAGCGNVSDEAQSRDEMWMPLWRTAIRLNELRILLSEGRATVGRRAAKDGLDFARAVCGFGVDRGITDFQRYAFLMRSGKAYLATPLARVHVSRSHQSDLITHLDRNNWLDRLRSYARDKNAPGRVRQLVRRLEDELFSLTQQSSRSTLQNILSLLGQIQMAISDSPKTRDAVAPMPRLGPEWTLEADDGSDEFRLACAIAGLTAMRDYLLPVVENSKTGRIDWAPGSQSAVWGGGRLDVNLLRVLDRRLLEAERNGSGTPFGGCPSADIIAAMAFLRGETDDRRIALLIFGLINAELPRSLPLRETPSERPPAVFCLLKPMFTTPTILHDLNLLPKDARLPLPRDVVALLQSGNREQGERAVSLAWRRLRIAGMKLPAYPRQPPDFLQCNSARLAATLMFPLIKSDLVDICKII